jgi:hypothetical protein
MTTTNDKTKHKFLIGDTYGSEYVTTEASYCCVEISEEDARNILSWMRKFEPGGALEGAACVEFWNYAATFVTDLDKLLPDFVGGQGNDAVFAFAQLVTHPDSLASERDGGPVVRMELDTMSISVDRVCWHAVIKHTDSLVESPGLTREQIEEMIADFAKETP